MVLQHISHMTDLISSRCLFCLLTPNPDQLVLGKVQRSPTFGNKLKQSAIKNNPIQNKPWRYFLFDQSLARRCNKTLKMTNEDVKSHPSPVTVMVALFPNLANTVSEWNLSVL